MSDQDDGGGTRRSSAVAASIREAVFRGEYVPGQRLVEVELCEAHQASRSVVRAALQELSGEGLLEIQRNRGARVRQVSRDEAIEITEVRRVVEGLIAAKAAERVEPEQAAELRRVGAAMRRAVEDYDALGYSELNAELHSAVRRIAGHETAGAIIERLRGRLVRHQFHLALRAGRPAASLVQHENIIEAIVKGDAAAAEAAMHAHLDDVLRALRELDA